MPEHVKEQPLTGSESLRNRIAISNFMTGGAIALWLIPICLLWTDIQHPPFILLVGVVSSLSLSSFLLGVVFRAQYRNAQRAEVAEQRYADLVHLVVENHEATQERITDLVKRVELITMRVGQEYFNAYADAVADVHGGPEVVDGTGTRSLNDHKIVPFTKVHNGR